MRPPDPDFNPPSGASPAPDPERDALRFDLLERPEAWPEDPAVQAELAQLLELSLALRAHGPALAPAIQPRRRWNSPWLAAAAAALLALVPGGFVVHRISSLQTQAQNRARLDGEAQKRAQARLWAEFFHQTSTLLKDFERRPPVCSKDLEDRNTERLAAVGLLQASHQLAAAGAPVPEAEGVRNDLHAWLSELALEDGCLPPARAEELRQWASTHNLSEEAERLGQLLAKGRS
jgi:hypothetical protein